MRDHTTKAGREILIYEAEDLKPIMEGLTFPSVECAAYFARGWALANDGCAEYTPKAVLESWGCRIKR